MLIGSKMLLLYAIVVIINVVAKTKNFNIDIPEDRHMDIRVRRSIDGDIATRYDSNYDELDENAMLIKNLYDYTNFLINNELDDGNEDNQDNSATIYGYKNIYRDSGKSDSTEKDISLNTWINKVNGRNSNEIMIEVLGNTRLNGNTNEFTEDEEVMSKIRDKKRNRSKYGYRNRDKQEKYSIEKGDHSLISIVNGRKFNEITNELEKTRLTKYSDKNAEHYEILNNEYKVDGIGNTEVNGDLIKLNTGMNRVKRLKRQYSNTYYNNMYRPYVDNRKLDSTYTSYKDGRLNYGFYSPYNNTYSTNTRYVPNYNTYTQNQTSSINYNGVNTNGAESSPHYTTLRPYDTLRPNYNPNNVPYTVYSNGFEKNSIDNSQRVNNMPYNNSNGQLFYDIAHYNNTNWLYNNNYRPYNNNYRYNHTYGPNNNNSSSYYNSYGAIVYRPYNNTIQPNSNANLYNSNYNNQYINNWSNNNYHGSIINNMQNNNGGSQNNYRYNNSNGSYNNFGWNNNNQDNTPFKRNFNQSTSTFDKHNSFNKTEVSYNNNGSYNYRPNNFVPNNNNGNQNTSPYNNNFNEDTTKFDHKKNSLNKTEALTENPEIIVQGCFLCQSLGCPKSYKRVNFNCVKDYDYEE